MTSFFDLKPDITFDLSSVAIGLITIWGVYLIYMGIDRLYFSPLAKIPGPKLAGLTTLYQAYYDVWLRGSYVFKIKDLHAQYGPIIRISPFEIHINDPEFIDGVYAGPGKKRDKHELTGRQVAQTTSMVVTMPHELHRKRRAALSPYFSKSSVRQLEPMIRENLVKLLGRLESAKKSGTILQMPFVYRAVMADIIAQYAFGKSNDFHLDREDFDIPFFDSLHKLFEWVPTFCHVVWLGPLINMMPVSFIYMLMPGLGMVRRLQQEWKGQIEEIVRTKDAKPDGDTFFHGLLESNLPDADKSMDRLLQEAQLIYMAGQDTGPTMASMTYEILANPSVLRTLKAELAEAIPNPNSPPTFAQVENLPYLSAVVRETLRLHPSASMRSQRISPDEPVVYRSRNNGIQYSIPAGTPMSMTAALVHSDPDIFPSPDEFRPERWLENPRLDRYILTFSRGTRICLGINLAYQELHLFTATIFRKYDLYDPAKGDQGPTLALYDTIRERDVDMVADLGVPLPAVGSHGIRLQVH